MHVRGWRATGQPGSRSTTIARFRSGNSVSSRGYLDGTGPPYLQRIQKIRLRNAVLCQMPSFLIMAISIVFLYPIWRRIASILLLCPDINVQILLGTRGVNSLRPRARMRRAIAITDYNNEGGVASSEKLFRFGRVALRQPVPAQSRRATVERRAGTPPGRAVFPPPPRRQRLLSQRKPVPAKMWSDDPSRAENESYLQRGARSRAACRLTSSLCPS